MVPTRDSRHGWFPPAELLLAPALVIVLINALTPTAALFPNQADVLVYMHKAEALARGEVPYRDFALEYPPLALLAMAVPYFSWPWQPPSFEVYRWLFTAWESLLLVVLVIVASRMAGSFVRGVATPASTAASRAIAGRVLVLVIVVAPSLAWRLDLLPATLAALAILAALQGRAALAGAAVGLGALAKIYPLALVPALAAMWLVPVYGRRLARFGAGLGATISIGLLPILVLAGDQAWSFVTYQAERGLQLETVPAGLILLAGAWSGGHVALTFDHNAVHVAGNAAELYLTVQPWLSLICFAALAALSLTLYRRELRFMGSVQPRTIIAISIAFILLLLVTNKVFSVQYTVWLLPLVAFLPRAQFWLAAVIGALSIGIHPLLYKLLIAQDAAVIGLLNVRNGLVVALLAWILATVVRGSIGQGANQAGGEEAAAER